MPAVAKKAAAQAAKQGERPTLPIYFTLVTDGPLPGESNLLYVGAQSASPGGEGVTWERCITPQNGRIRPHCGIGEALAAKLARGAVPVTQAMRELVEWLQRFHGLRLPVTSSVGYWHLVYHLSHVTGLKDFPLLMNPIDCNSFWAGSRGSLQAARLVRGKDPWSAQNQRTKIIQEAIMNATGDIWDRE